jgi:Icc-related predicted phosphoesterase
LIALCLADLHSSATALRRLDGLLARERFDLVLAAGDITIAGHEPYAKDFIALVRRHGCPLLLVHGNNDTLEAVETFRREGVTIHRRERELYGRRFVGFGDDASVGYDELAEGESLELRLDGAILLTHLPPPGLRYVPQDSRPAASASPLVLANAPLVQVCGHIHHQEGVARLGATKVVKVRAAMWNRCATLDLATLRARFRNLAV